MARSLGSEIGHSRGGSDSTESKYAERIIHLEDERRGLAEDIKAIYAEAKENEVRVKPIRRAVKIYFEPEDVREERKRIQDEAEIIIFALGGYADTPLGKAAVDAVGEEEAALRDAETAPKQRRRRSRAETAIEAAQAHLNGGEESPPA